MSQHAKILLALKLRQDANKLATLTRGNKICIVLLCFAICYDKKNK